MFSQPALGCPQPLTGCLILGKSLTLSDPRFLICKMRPTKPFAIFQVAAQVRQAKKVVLLGSQVYKRGNIILTPPPRAGLPSADVSDGRPVGLLDPDRKMLTQTHKTLDASGCRGRPELGVSGCCDNRHIRIASRRLVAKPAMKYVITSPLPLPSGPEGNSQSPHPSPAPAKRESREEGGHFRCYCCSAVYPSDQTCTLN